MGLFGSESHLAVEVLGKVLFDFSDDLRLFRAGVAAEDQSVVSVLIIKGTVRFNRETKVTDNLLGQCKGRLACRNGHIVLR